MAGDGKPLDPAVRTEMESSFGADFSNVRIHTDAASEGTAKALGAIAYTSGQDIFFNAGQYQPNTHHGKKLLAHELAHVVQQAQGRVRPTRIANAERGLSAQLVAGGSPASMK